MAEEPLNDEVPQPSAPPEAEAARVLAERNQADMEALADMAAVTQADMRLLNDMSLVTATHALPKQEDPTPGAMDQARFNGLVAKESQRNFADEAGMARLLESQRQVSEATISLFEKMAVMLAAQALRIREIEQYLERSRD